MLKLPEYPHFATQTLELRQHIAIIITVVSTVYLLRPVKNELFIDLEDAFICLRNWSFT
jgi:hypothetical protein